MLTRREWLKRSALVSLAPTVPMFLAQCARAAAPQRDGRVLVVIQLDGGNDGINTVVPFGDEGYARHRKELRLPRGRLCKLDQHVGLHPSMRAAADLVEDGRLAVVQGVGYPNPSRSHFRSMAIWHSARLEKEQHDGPGWLGRALDAAALDAAPRTTGGPDAIHIGRESLPRPLRSRRAVSASFADAADLSLSLHPPTGPAPQGGDSDDVTAFVRRSVSEAYATAEQLDASTVRGPREGAARGSAGYPETGLGRRLDVIARVLKSGSAARVYYVVQSGYDTHAVQLPHHARLLREFSGAVKAFLDDLAAARLAERVVVLAFSEFGRRVAENGSLGTDHGTAGPVFLAGPAVRGGLHGPTPSLTELDPQGDLKWSLDFRRVYATVLADWLGLPPAASLGGVFKTLPLFNVPPDSRKPQ